MRWMIRLLAFLLIVPLAYYSVFPEIFWCQIIAYSSDFQPLENGILVAHETPEHHRIFLLDGVRQAKERLRGLWRGPLQGHALLVYCHTPEQYERYCHDGEGAGCSLGTPWGQSWIIVNPYGRNADVLAHEMCHNELYTRLGWLTTQRQIPQWFNEGLALMVDQRFATVGDSLQRYETFQDQWQYQTHGHQVVLELAELESLRGFFSGGQDRVMLAYMTAGMEVARWLAVVGRQGLAELVQKIQAGESFDGAYQQLNARSKRQKKAVQHAEPLQEVNEPVGFNRRFTGPAEFCWSVPDRW